MGVRVGREPFKVERMETDTYVKMCKGVLSVIQESIHVRLHKGLSDLMKKMIKGRLLTKNVKR